MTVSNPTVSMLYISIESSVTAIEYDTKQKRTEKRNNFKMHN